MKKIFRNAFIALAAATVLAVGAGFGMPALSGAIGKDAFTSPASASVSSSVDMSTGTEDAVAVFDPFDSGDFGFEPEDGTTYMIRETSDGKIGVFRKDGESPLVIVDIYVFTLPEGAAALLREGFECDAETLSGLIDTFTS